MILALGSLGLSSTSTRTSSKNLRIPKREEIAANCFVTVRIAGSRKHAREQSVARDTPVSYEFDTLDGEFLFLGRDLGVQPRRTNRAKRADGEKVQEDVQEWPARGRTSAHGRTPPPKSVCSPLNRTQSSSRV
jgi:hypothetical protein